MSHVVLPGECDCSCHRESGVVHNRPCCDGQCPLCKKFVTHAKNHIEAEHPQLVFCDCKCHEPGASIIHFMACCHGPCEGCGRPIKISPLGQKHLLICRPTNPRGRHKLR